MLSNHKTQQHCAASPPTIMTPATSENLTQAYQWAGKSRGNSSSNNSIWHLLKTKRQLRVIVKLTYRILNQLKLKMHPDLTFIGRTSTGFDFLGVHFGSTASISKTSQANHPTKLAGRYAQGASTASIGIYIDRWASWCNGLIKRCNAVYTELSIHLPAIPHENQMGGFTENQNEDFIANCYN